MKHLIKKTVLLMCGVMLTAMQGCVRDDLNECPPSVRYALAFDYWLHIDSVGTRGVKGGLHNHFAREVDKMNIYAFDKTTNKCVFIDTTMTGPFTNDYLYSLPLGGGNYDIIVWGWGRQTGNLHLTRSSGVVSSQPGIGSDIREFKFMLNEVLKGENEIHGKIEKIFYGEIPNLNIPSFISKIDTIDLKNISKTVRVIIPDIVNDTTSFPNWKENVKISIESANGGYHFKTGSSFDHAPYFHSSTYASATPHRYHPHQIGFTDSILRHDPINSKSFSSNPNDTVGIVMDISTLRLVESDMDTKIVVSWHNGIESKQTEISLLDLLLKNPDYAWGGNIQRDLDRQDRWEIVLPVSDTYVTVSTEIMSWQIVKQDVAIGGILQ